MTVKEVETGVMAGGRRGGGTESIGSRAGVVSIGSYTVRGREEGGREGGREREGETGREGGRRRNGGREREGEREERGRKRKGGEGGGRGSR